MFLVDSSGWIAFFAAGSLSGKYEKYIKNPVKIVKPTVVLCEVYKKIRRERTEDEALAAASVINRTKIVPLSESIALLAADLSIKYSLPMADAMVNATAFEEDCQVVTGDAHFRDLERVIFVA